VALSLLNQWLLFKRHHKIFPNETILNVKIPNPKNGKNPKHKNPELLLGEWLYWHPILT
jgi:hypothetical protein